MVDEVWVPLIEALIAMADWLLDLSLWSWETGTSETGH